MNTLIAQHEWVSKVEIQLIKRSKMPLEYLDDTKVLHTVLCDNFAKNMKEFRPLEDYRCCMREWGRDYLRTFLANKGISFSQEEILDFEAKMYGTL